jgi:hypothetical protein
VSTPPRHALITGWGRYAPSQVLTNADLERMVETSDEWIRTRTGIRERRVAAVHETTASMAAVAGLLAIRTAGLDPDEIDLILLATLTPDYWMPATATLAPVSTGTTVPVYGQIALKHIEALSEGIGPRQAGTTDESKAAQYIEAALKELGYQTSLQPFTFPGADGTTQYSTNVIAVKAGQSTKVLIVGAHYDSIPAGKGADDNASGVAVMLEAAELVKAGSLAIPERAACSRWRS